MTMNHLKRRNVIFLAAILLLALPKYKFAQAAVHTNQHGLSLTTTQRPHFTQTAREFFHNKKKKRRDSFRLLATAPMMDDDYSRHRLVSIHEEPLFQEQQKDKENTTEKSTGPLSAWKRLFTRPTQSVWPLQSTIGLSKVPMDTSTFKKEFHGNHTSLLLETPQRSIQNEYHINDTAVNHFMTNDTRITDEGSVEDESHHHQQQQQSRQRPTQLDVQQLMPALALPSSLSISSIRTKLLSILRHPRLSKWTLTGMQLGLAFYLLNAVIKAAAEVVDELGGDSSPHLLKVEQVKQIIASLDDGDFKALSSSLLQQQPTLQHLTSTLLASGMPLRSREENSVERVLLSLTRSEANLLQQCLWTLPNEATSFATIAGLQSIKHSLLDLVWTLKSNSSPRHKKLNPYSHLVEHPPGILLYGPPGCGKTMLVKALAASTQLPCLVVTPSVLLRKYVGDTNLQVRALFSLAQKLSPCILCIDELDGLFRERSSTEHDVSRDLKTEFLQWWDGIASDGRILIVGATNRPFEVDSAVLRRMPQSYFVGLPNYEARKQFLSSLLGNIPTSTDLQLHPLAAETEGYTPSDLKQVVRMAITMGPIREARFSLKYRPLSMKDVGQARAIVSPTPLTPGYRAALTDYAQRNSGMHSSQGNNNNNNGNNNHDPWDSFYNAGTIHASHGSAMPEWSEDGEAQNGVGDDDEEDYSYEQDDESESDDDDDDDDL